MKKASFGAIVLVAMCLIAAPSAGYLKIHPSNPHYFQETTTGKAVLIHGLTSIVPSDTAWDYVNEPGGINWNLARRVEWSRVWHFLPWGVPTVVWPWGRSGTPGAPMGGNKIDMNTWDPEYWSRMSDALTRTDAGGMYAEIHFFDRCGMSPPDPTRWQSNPWARENNVNNLETPTYTSDGTPEFYQWSSKPNLRNQQERYIRKMIDQTVSYNNVVYEIENEHWESSSVGWADHYSQFVKDYIAANYPGLPRLVTYSSIESDTDLDSCYSMPALDVVNKHYGDEPESNPSILNAYLESRWGYNKAMNVDEFGNFLDDYNICRQMCWTIVSSGGNFHLEDPFDGARAYDVIENIRSFLALSGWNFVGAAPNKNLITSGGGYCMAQPGVEYVCYFPTGGAKTITLAAATYRAEWWNPRTGGFSSVSSFAHGGGGKALSSPDSNDWVLHLTTQAAPTTTLQSKVAAAALTIDGNSSDWALADFTTRIGGGEVGFGHKAVVGYDTTGVCYTGGHWTGGQYPPANAADHAVRIYSRNDASYLYFLARCDDSDIQYPSAVDSNHLNDCVEFYIDPGHDHGSTAISSSSSDFQLVIDANNQKNIYSTTSTYKTQLLGGITSAVVRDASGWWLEARIAKSVMSPVVPAAGTIGIDFSVRDNDSNNTAAQTSICSWRDPETNSSFPTKIPARWGDLSLQGTWNSLGNQLEVGNGATPGVGVDSQGNIHVVYMGGGNIYYRKVEGSTLALGSVEQIPNPEGTGDYCCACVKCDANGVPHVVFQRGWAGDSHRTWYSNRIGGSWKTPVKIIDNNLLGLDGRANYPRMALYGSYAYVAVFGVPGEMVDGSEGTIVRVTNLSTTPVVDRTGYTPLWVPHPMITADGRLFVSGRHTTQGYKYQEFSPTTLQAIGSMILLTGGMDRYPGEENAACIDRDGVIHAVGAYNTNQDTGIWRGRIFYNSSVRAAASQAPIVGLEGTSTWDSIQVYPTIATDSELKVYISWWFDPTGEGKITTINGSSYATPVTYASHVTQYMRWNPQIAATPTGGVFAAWDYAGKCYVRGIGVGSFAGGGAPGPVTNFSATGGPNRAILAWQNPSESSFTGTMIRYKTTGYPTSATDGTLAADRSGAPGSSDTFTHTGLTNGVTYYYSAFAHDAAANYAAKADASATPQALTSVTLNSKPAGTITIDGSSSDWSLSDFTTKVRAGADATGDCAITGYDNGALFYAAYWTDGSLPTSAADHTAKVYSRHSGSYVYFLIRCDDDQMLYSSPTSANWANDCVEFYFDPANNHGSTGLTEPGTSTSDLQLVIDANNQRNVYCCTTTYKNQVLAGVTSAVVRDATGWWLEARISKSALDPDLAVQTGTFGLDFAFRDNDNNMDPVTSSMYTWVDSVSGSAFPSKVPDRWGNVSMQAPPDVMPPAAVTSFVAAPGDMQVSLSWHNPSDADFAGAMIRFSTVAFPAGPTDGALVIDKANSPNTNDSYVHTGLTNGIAYYYSAFAHDGIPNYATKTSASATPADTTAPGPVTGFTLVQGDTRNFLMWTNPGTSDFAGAKVLFKTTGYPTGPTDGTAAYQGAGTSCTHSGLTNGTTYYYAAYAYDEVPNYSSAAQGSAAPVYFSPAQAKVMGNNATLTLTAGVVSAVFGDSFYVQCVGDTCGASGIKVTKPGHAMLIGQSATVKGTILTDAATGERYISAAWVNGSGTSTVDPLAVTNRTLGGADWQYNAGTGAGQQGVTDGVGANTIGLFVRVWGKVTQRDTTGLTYFYIDDGSDLSDTTTTGGTANVGVRVIANPTGYAAGSYAVLQGISSCFKDDSGNIRPRILFVSSDVTPPAPVTSFAAATAPGQVNLTWTNPADADFAGTMIRFKTTGYPTGPTDGTQCYNGTASGYNHTGRTNGTTYYYCAYAYDEVPNHATAAQASATPTAPVVISNSTFDSNVDGWTTAVWRAGPDYDPGTMAWASSGGNPGGCMQSTGYGISDGDDRCLREGGEIYKTISTLGHSGVKVYYGLKVNSLSGNYTGVGSGTCQVDHNLVDEQLTVFYSVDGGSNWIESGYLLRSALLTSYQSFGTRTVDLTGISTCNNNPGFALRFRWQFNHESDAGWLDNIRVEANN